MTELNISEKTLRLLHSRINILVTLKDHKNNFQNTLPCRLINPSKSELGRISKFKLEKINQQLLNLLKFNQWKNSDSVIEWFKNIEDKKNCAFVKFDIKEFYPSITESILDNAINFAKLHCNLSDDGVRII